MSLYTHTEEINMFIQPILGWIKSLTEEFKKPQTYGSALEAYIVANEPQNAGDVDRLTREFDQKMSTRCTGGFPC
jgi:hypothetical protein